MTEKPAKVIGAMKHLLLELQKVNVINDIDREHLLDRYIRGRIMGFGHLAEWLDATANLGEHNYNQIIEYGRRYGEQR
jgi:aminoglycoside phosphotransferase (APT) family kinase protein